MCIINHQLILIRLARYWSNPPFPQLFYGIFKLTLQISQQLVISLMDFSDSDDPGQDDQREEDHWRKWDDQREEDHWREQDDQREDDQRERDDHREQIDYEDYLDGFQNDDGILSDEHQDEYSEDYFMEEIEETDYAFNFDAYQIDEDYIPVTEVTNVVTYILDELPFAEAFYAIESQGKVYCEKREKFAGILRIRKQLTASNVMEILCFNNGRQYKAEVLITQIKSISTYKSDSLVCINFDWPPRFFENVNNIKNKKLDSEKDLKQQMNYAKYQRRFATYHLMQEEIKKDNGLLKFGRKKWERIINLSASINSSDDFIARSFDLKCCTLVLRLNNFEQLLNKLKNSLSGFEKIYHLSQSQSFVTSPIKVLTQKFNYEVFNEKFIKYEKQNSMKAFDVKYSLISLLYNCQSLGVEEIMELSDYIIKNYNVDEARKILVEHFHSEDIFMHLAQKKKLEEIFLIMEKRSKKRSKKSSKKKNTENITVPTFKMTPSGIIPGNWSTDLRNRLTRHFQSYDFQFIKIEVSDDDDNRSLLFNCGDRMQDELINVLSRVKMLGRVYIPLGWTQSQLKTNSMWFTLEKYEGPFIKIEQLIDFLGSFNDIKNPALKAARIGQNLSTSKSLNVAGVNVKMMEDDRIGKYLYTDGIGQISGDLIERINKQLKVSATIFQIRFQGCKGVLTLNRQLPPNTIILRRSLKKFECPNPASNQYLDILDYNYYKPGYMNRQIMILLSANNINEPLLQIQKEYIQSILESGLNLQELVENPKGDYDLVDGFKEKLFENGNANFKVQNIGEIMTKINKKKSLEIISEPTLRGILVEKYIQKFEKLIKKNHFKVQKSARIIGIIDDFNILKEDEIYCTIVNSNQQRFNVSGKVMLTRNPCMHPSDIRVVTAISDAEALKRFENRHAKSPNYFLELINCVIFPKAGKIPLTAQISGSDLDGDTFFITWDQRLVPANSRNPYVSDDESKVSGDHKTMIEFFAEFVFNNNLGRLANAHLAHADKKGPECYQCIELCKAHNAAVDYPKKGYRFQFEDRLRIKQFPHFMQKGSEKRSYRSSSILGRAYDQSKAYFEQFISNNSKVKFRIKNLQIFYSMHYSDQQIIDAYRIVTDFNEQIRALLTMYKFQREFQIYCIKASFKCKQNREKIRFVEQLRVTYFQKFFEGIPIDCSPMLYYIRFKKERREKLEKSIERKLLLWYHLSYYNWMKIDKNDENEFAWVQRVKKLLGNLKVEFIGLAWFSVPYFTYVLLHKRQKYKLKET